MLADQIMLTPHNKLNEKSGEIFHLTNPNGKIEKPQEKSMNNEHSLPDQ